MRIYECADYAAMSRQAANIIAAQIVLKPGCVLGLATGSTPIGAYDRLTELHQAGDLSFAGVSTVNLDEYRGLGPDHSQSYRYFMDHNLFDRVDIDKSRTNVPDGLAPDGDEECARYDRLIASLGGIDLQLLGLGRNGHIGFNEPDDVFTLATHVVNLTHSTIEANKRFFASADDVPRQALTMGVGAILGARRVLVVAAGEDKADALAAAFCGPVDPRVPASILRLHRRCVLVADKAALSKLPDRSEVVRV